MRYIGGEAASRLASAFSTAVYRDLSRSALGFDAAQRIRPIIEVARQGSTLGEAFDRSYELVSRQYRSEYFYKNTLISRIVFGRHSPRTAAAVLELRMGRSWADVVVLNGTSTTYEIKTDLDQFTRLRTQLPDYVSRSEFVNVVVSEKRATVAERQLPLNIGVVLIRSKSGSLATARPAESNLQALRADDLFSMLRTSEALQILRHASSEVLDESSFHSWKLLREAFAKLPVDIAHAGVVRELRNRGKRDGKSSMLTDFPKSLRALAYSTTGISAVGERRILDRLSTPAELLRT